MSKSKGLVYPPEDVLKPLLIEKNYELIILWMLDHNDSCGWSDFTEYKNEKFIPQSTLQPYLKSLIEKGYLEKPERNKYLITSEGKVHLNELIFLRESGGRNFVYPPELLLRRRNYDHWILWMLYNNESCRWSDFTNEPLNINQSSLSKNIKKLVDKDFIKNENKEYLITQVGKSEYFNILREYELDRQSILEEESKRILEFTKFTNEFFDKFGIEDDAIKFRFLNNVLKLNYSRVENMLEEEEDFNKILLFLSINHPDQYPNYISPERFAHEYNLKKTTLDFFIEKIVEEEFYEIKFFKLEANTNKEYYFQANEKVERLLRAIVDDYITRFTYLNNLYENTSKKAPALTISNIIEKILSEICPSLFNDDLRDALRNFLPDYIKYLAYKIETEKKLVTGDSKLEGLIWQTISEEFETFTSKNSKEKRDQVDYSLDHSIFEALNLYYLSKLDFIEYNEIAEKYITSNRGIFNEFIKLSKKGEFLKASTLYKEKKNQLDEIESLIFQDIINTSQSKFEESVEVTSKIIEKIPTDYIGYLFQSITYFLMDDLEKSLEVIEEGIENAFNISLIAQKAQILIKKDEEQEALKLTEDALSTFPNSALLLRTKYLAIISDPFCCSLPPDRPLRVIDSAINLEPKKKEFLVLKAVILCMTKRYKEAEELIREEIDFNIFKKNPNIDTTAFLLLVYSCIGRGKFDDAFEIANNGVVIYSNHPISYLTKALVIGYSLIYKSDLEEANPDTFVSLINRAFDSEPIRSNQALYLQFKALVLGQVGGYEEALNALEDAIELNPRDYDLHISKVYYLMTYGRENEAINFIDDIISQEPKLKARLNKIKSFIYFKNQNYEAGLEVIDEVIKEHPDDKKLLNNKVLLLVKLDRVEEAIETAEILIKVDPEDGNSYDTYGEALKELGKYTEAIEKFEKAIELDPKGWYLSDTYQKMGKCYEELDNDEKATRCYQKSNELEEKRLPLYRKMYEKKSD
ncbi:MAG: tetratricopeptide repeat protein [Promethearchaeota archaeon]